MSLDCDSLPSHSTKEDLCIEPPGEDDNFPGDDQEFDAATDLFHHDSGTLLSTSSRFVYLKPQKNTPTEGQKLQ